MNKESTRDSDSHSKSIDNISAELVEDCKMHDGNENIPNNCDLNNEGRGVATGSKRNTVEGVESTISAFLNVPNNLNPVDNSDANHNEDGIN